MTKVAFVLLVPYSYAEGEPAQNKVLSNFFKVFEAEGTALQTDQHSVHIILQPNLKSSNNLIFNLNKKIKGEWVPLAKVIQMEASKNYKFRYKVDLVYPGGEKQSLNKVKLEVGKTLHWKCTPKKTVYQFTESALDEFHLRKILDNTGELSEPWARCVRLPSDHVNWKSNWKVLEVLPAGVKKVIGSELVNLGDERTVPAGDSLEVKWIKRPRKFVFQRIQDQTEVPDDKITKEEREKWQGQLNGAVTVLPLLRWHNFVTNNQVVQYGFFRNTLLHHQTTVKTLNNLVAAKNIVYAHIFDPDIVSLRVKTKTETTLLFTEYCAQIFNIAGSPASGVDLNELPAILSSSFCFEDKKENIIINQLFALSTELNIQLHSELPGAGYFSECNTLLLYNVSYWKDLKFSRDSNEIMPIVKILSKTKKVIYITGALPTTIPERMEKWQESMQNLALPHSVDRVGDQAARGGKNYFLYLEQCPQVPLLPLKWARRVTSAISTYIKNKDKKLSKWLCALWKFYSPTRSYQEKGINYSLFHAFVQTEYGAQLKYDDEKASLKNIRCQLKKYSLTKKCPYTKKVLWTKVETAAKSCGQACINHFNSWMVEDTKIRKCPTIA